MTARGSRSKKARSRRAGPDRPASLASPLGNDPFERGAAVRAPAVLTPVPAPPPEPAVGASALDAAVPAPPALPADSAFPAPAMEAALPAPAEAAPASPPTTREVEAGTTAAERAATATVASVRFRLGELEARVESAAASAAARLGELAREEVNGQHGRDLRRAILALLPAITERLSAVAGVGASLLSRGEVDAWGFDPQLAERLSPLVDFLYQSWWRVVVRGIEHVPASGPVLVVANHGGVLPWDALVLRTALRRDHPARRELRPLLDEHALRRRISGAVARRLGAVQATPEHALQLLEAGGAVAVFPEGSRGATRPWPERYRIQRFGRGGFAKLALRIGAPIVPCAIVGSEETGLPMARAGWLSSALGIPFLTSPPPFPFLPLGALPLPARWSLRFGAPIETGDGGPDASADAAHVADVTERARASLQRMLDEDVAARRSVYL